MSYAQELCAWLKYGELVDRLLETFAIPEPYVDPLLWQAWRRYHYPYPYGIPPFCSPK